MLLPSSEDCTTILVIIEAAPLQLHICGFWVSWESGYDLLFPFELLRREPLDLQASARMPCSARGLLYSLGLAVFWLAVRTLTFLVIMINGLRTICVKHYVSAGVQKSARRRHLEPTSHVLSNRHLPKPLH